jgi:DNA gyrase subunit A
MASLLNLQPGEKVVTILPVRNLEEEGKFILFATRNGIVKKTPLKDFSNVMARGIIAIAIEKSDDLIEAGITDGKSTVFLASREGMAIRFNEEYDAERGSGLRPMGRNAAGNKGISLKKGDQVIGIAITLSDETRDRLRDEFAAKLGLTARLTTLRVQLTEAKEALHKAREDRRNGKPEDEALKAAEKAAEKAVDDTYWKDLKSLDEKLGVGKSLILTVTENGFGKRTDIDEYRLTARGAQGVNNLKATSKVGKTMNILPVDETSELMVISQFGKMIRIDTKTIRAAGRSTQGVKLLNLEPDDKVAAAVVIPPEDIKEDEQGTLLQ